MKWNSGINYKTNRKIKIGGKIYKELGKRFVVNYGNINYGFYEHSISFADLVNINVEDYIQETKIIVEKINKECYIIDDIINKIKNLEKWNDFVEYQRIKYGLPKVLDKIHCENNCNGNIKEYDRHECRCNKCENWFYNGHGDTIYYKCDNCDYKFVN